MATYAPVQETLAAPAGPPIDPDVLDQRRKLAQALIAQAMGGEPIGSWTQGLANLAQALMGGYNVRKTNQQEAAGRASGAADTAAALEEIAAMGGGGGGYTEPATTGSTSSGGGGIGSDFAASMTPEEAIVRTVAGEAAGEPAEGQAAVAAVILNRAKKAGKSPQQIVLAKNQFEPWARNPQRLMALTKDSPKYQQILANIQPALQGQDVTGGATHFYAPKAQAALGRNMPAWARGPYQDIGNHRFFKLAGGGGETAALPNVEPVAASPSPDVMAFLGRPNKQQYPVDPQSLDMKVGPDFLATQPQPAGLSIGDGAVARVPQPRPEPPTELPYDTGADPRTPQPRPNLAQALALPPASGRGTVPLPPVQPVARAPQPRPTPPAPAPAPAPAAAAPATTASIPQRRAPIFREPYPSVLSAQEFARQGQNYLTGRPSFPDQQAAAPAQPRRGLLQALLGRGGPQAPAAAQPAPAGSPVAAGATAAPTAAPAAAPAGGQSSRVSALLANPYVSDTVKAAVLARLMPKQQDPFTLGPDEKRYDANGNLIATGPDKPEVTSRPLVTPEERAAAGIPPDDKRPYQVDTRGKVDLVGGAGLTVNTGGGGTDKQIFDTLGTSADAARAAVTGLNGIREARAAIKGGIITGSFANERLSLQKLGAFLGVADPNVIENTETFRAAIAPQVAAMLKATVGSANISNTDREFAEKAAGGNITLDEKSIERLLGVMEKAGRVVVETHNKKLDAVYPESGGFTRERALFHVDEPVAEAGAVEKGAPGSSKDNPVSIGTQADYDRLPSGAYYVDDDGSIKVKS